MVSVLISGRPLLINQILSSSNAVISAWLPGTAGGQGIFEAISGDYLFRPNGTKKNTLSVDWPVDMVKLSLFRLLWRISLFIDGKETFQKFLDLDTLSAMDYPHLLIHLICFKSDIMIISHIKY